MHGNSKIKWLICQTDMILDLVSFNVDFKTYNVEILPVSEMNNKNGCDFSMCVCLIQFMQRGSRYGVNQKREKWNF